jgi:hypothetical protein
MTERHKNVHFSGPHKFHKSTHCCVAQPAIILLNLIKDGLQKLAPITTLQTWFRMHLVSISLKDIIPGILVVFLLPTMQTVPQTTSQLLPSMFFPIYYWDYPALNAIQYELLSTRLNKI